MGGFGYTLRSFAGDMVAMILFLVLVLVTRNIWLATGLGVAAGVGQVTWLLLRRKPVGALQWASVGLVGVFGSATLVFHDPRFIMFKPTVINLILAAVMMRPGWMERYVPANVRDAARPMLTVFGYIWAALMLLTAALNAVVALTSDPATWAKFNLIFPPVSMIGLFLAQNLWMRTRAAAAGYRIPGAN
jgi:intracellular septation protein